MNKAFEKILERLENIGWVYADYYPDGTNISRVSKKSVSYDEVKKIVQEVAEEYNNGWIPCSERLPEEPEEGLTDLDECDEYIAMIENADIPTALNYAGNGEWYRDGEFYKVIAWQPLPEPYKEND